MIHVRGVRDAHDRSAARAADEHPDQPLSRPGDQTLHHPRGHGRDFRRPDTGPKFPLVTVVQRLPSGFLSPKTDAGPQEAKRGGVLPRNNNVSTTPATNPPTCAM